LRTKFDRYFSITTSYFPSGIAFVAFAIALKIPIQLAIALSLIVYSGAVQSAFLGFWVTGIEPVSMLLTAFLLNLRHTFYGPHIESQRNDITLKDVLTIGPFLTDEVYALSVSEPAQCKRNVFFLAIFGYSNWFMAAIFPARMIYVLLLALPTLFLGLLVPRVKSNYAVAAALSAGALAVFGRLEHFSSFFIVVPIFCGVLIGYLWRKYLGGRE